MAALIHSASLNFVTGLKRPSIKDAVGKKLIVEFWAPWCDACIGSMTYLALLQEQYRDKLMVIGISVEPDLESILDFVKKYGIQFPTSVDKDGISSRLSIEVVPTTIVFSEDGELIYKKMGFDLESGRELEKVLFHN